jgi:hypothetical protein
LLRNSYKFIAFYKTLWYKRGWSSMRRSLKAIRPILRILPKASAVVRVRSVNPAGAFEEMLPIKIIQGGASRFKPVQGKKDFGTPQKSCHSQTVCSLKRPVNPTR